MPNIIKKLEQNQPTIGSWMQLPNPSVAEIMGRSGYDWIAVDMEHGSFSLHQLPEIFRALELGGTLPFVRVAQAQMTEIKQALDAGARGLIYPMIQTATQLEQAINWSFYPPRGIRGVGYSRTNGFGKYFDSYVHEESSQFMIVAQIEHIEAVEKLDEILSVSGLHAIMVGPYDLSASMGLTAQFDHPRFIEAMERIKLMTLKNNVPMGMHVVQPDEQVLKQKIAEGYRFIAYSIDAVFLYRTAQNPVGSTT
ncbi:MAG: 2,4-dihydroxyhept-2-ene-1,7-dioic acid aldolase [SAR324 cluster bacterium]|nr:2,4-dihydroxyhept-2-ene-1,7-dioic acid aldolase [SAR324 cluster bacterium]